MGVYNITKNVGNWNITDTYSSGTIVKYGDKEFIALKDVPKGINIGDTTYWVEYLGDIDDKLTELDERVADIEDDIERIEEIIDFEKIYSLEEKVIGKWIDGSTLYRRTFILENLPSGETQKQYEVFDTIVTPVKMYGIYAGANCIPVTGYFTSCIGVYIQNEDVEVSTLGVRTNITSVPSTDKIYITIEYLKESDENE